MTTDPHAPETLLRRAAAENAELRDLLTAVAGGTVFEGTPYPLD